MSKPPLRTNTDKPPFCGNRNCRSKMHRDAVRAWYEQKELENIQRLKEDAEADALNEVGEPEFIRGASQSEELSRNDGSNQSAGYALWPGPQSLIISEPGEIIKLTPSIEGDIDKDKIISDLKKELAKVTNWNKTLADEVHRLAKGDASRIEEKLQGKIIDLRKDLDRKDTAINNLKDELILVNFKLENCANLRDQALEDLDEYARRWGNLKFIDKVKTVFK